MTAPRGVARFLPEGVPRAVLDALPLAVVVVDRRDHAVYANPLARRLVGDDLKRRRVVPWSEGAGTPVVGTSATRGPVRVTTLPLEDHEGLTLAVLTAVPVGAEGEPHGDPVRRLDEVEATAQVGSWSWDIAANVVTWSDELYRMYGLAPQSVPVSYESYMQLLPEEERGAVSAVVGRCRDSGRAAVFTHRVVLPDGEERWHQSRAQTLLVDGHAVRMFGTAQDITERTRSEQALRDSLSQAQQLAGENKRLRGEIEAQLAEVRASRSRIVQATDDARRRLERDLHDGAQQRLTTVGLMLRSAQARIDFESDPELHHILEQAVQELQEGLRDLRALARGLHPAILTEEGLIPAVRALVARSPVAVEFAAESIPGLPGPVESAAYFLVSEALTNVIKHATATAVTVTIAQVERRLTVEVSDNGLGGATIDSGSGLRGLSDRVAALDGRLQLHSPTDGGTLLRAELPCA